MIWLQKCGVFPNSPGWIYFRQYLFPFTPGLRGVTSFWRFCETILNFGMGIPPAVISTVIHLTNSCLFSEGRVNMFFRLLEETSVRRSCFFSPAGFYLLNSSWSCISCIGIGWSCIPTRATFIFPKFQFLNEAVSLKVNEQYWGYQSY